MRNTRKFRDWFKNWEATGLINFDDKNEDGSIQYRGAHSEVDNELTIDRDIMVLANPEIAKLPNWVVGLVAAGGLAAALSTAAGLLLFNFNFDCPRSIEAGASPRD